MHESSDRLDEFQLNPNALNIESTMAFTDEWNLELKRRSERINPGDVVRIKSNRLLTNEWAVVDGEDNTESTCTLLTRKGKLTGCFKAQLELIELNEEQKASVHELMMRMQCLYKKLRKIPINTIGSGAFLKGISVKEFPQNLTTIEDCGLRAIESFVD
ncbi:MAG: hypothetical protein QNJ54_06635 [Prochloraceae cyanobacterium]|nr:hypothetical protein [Prochloraceae cyanobacterium]